MSVTQKDEFKMPFVDVNDKASTGDTWHAQLFVSKDVGGRPNFSMPKSEMPSRKQFIMAAHAEAERLRKARGKGRSGNTVDPNMLMSDYAKQVIADRNIGGSKTGEPIKPRTRRIYDDAWRLWIGPVMGGLKLKQVNSAAMVEDKLAAIRSRGGQGGKALSDATLYQISRAVSIVIGAMCRAGRFEFQQLHLIEWFKKPEPKQAHQQVHLDGTDITHAMARLEKTLDKVRFSLGVLVGLRPGEMLALKWTNMKPSTVPGAWMEINVNATLTVDYDRKSIFQDETKSAAGMRQYLVPTALRSLLEPLLMTWKEEQIGTRRDRGLETDSHAWFVMSNQEGEEGAEGNMRSWFQTKIKQGILPKGFTPHNLRHTYGTHFTGANGGVVSLAMAKLMGHRDTKVAETFYASVIKTDQVAQAEKHAERMIGFMTPKLAAE